MFYNIQRKLLWPILIILAFGFSALYASIEYYVIGDTTMGYGPILFSLFYPYHIVMALVFASAACALLSSRVSIKRPIWSLVMVCALLSSMLAIEDFTWFVLRAAAPVKNDINAGKLILTGEWTTQFMGSVDAHFTAIPNWYFLSIAFSAIVVAKARRRRLAPIPSDHLLIT